MARLRITRTSSFKFAKKIDILHELGVRIADRILDKKALARNMMAILNDLGRFHQQDAQQQLALPSTHFAFEPLTYELRLFANESRGAACTIDLRVLAFLSELDFLNPFVSRLPSPHGQPAERFPASSEGPESGRFTTC